MSADERSALAVWLEVCDLGVMARAARVWSDVPRARQIELKARLRDGRAKWAMVWCGADVVCLARGPTTFSALMRLGDHLWIPQYGTHSPISSAHLLCVGAGRCWTGEWMEDAELDLRSKIDLPLTWSDRDYPKAERGMPKRLDKIINN